MQSSLEIYRRLVAQIRAEAVADMIQNLRGGSSAPPIARSVRAEFKTIVRTQRASAAPRIASKGRQRKPEDVSNLTESAFAYIAKNPKQTATEISEGMGVTTDELRYPLRILRESKRVTMKGTRRNARYTVKAP
jgi:predicted HTH transcriptional regulator